MHRADAHRHLQTLGRRARAWRSDRDGSFAATADLVDLARADDTAALGELLECHRPQVRGVCWRLGVCRMDADDYVQEGLLAMLPPIHRYDRGRGVPLWGYARLYVRGRLVALLGRSVGLSAHEAGHYRRVLTARDVAVRDGLDGSDPEAVRSVLRRGAGPAVSASLVASVLRAEAAFRVPFDEDRDRLSRAAA